MVPRNVDIHRELVVVRYLSLDGLRAVAAIVVLAFHAQLPLTPAGFFGVDIFFVLSGFVITSVLLHHLNEDKHFNVLSFYSNRLVRLYPTLILMLLIVVPTAWFFIGKLKPWEEIIYSGFYLSDLTRSYSRSPDVTHHSWSLAVEMQFYLLWPLLLIGMMRLERSKIVIILLIAYVVMTCWRYGMFTSFGWRRAYYPIDTRSTGLILGCLLAFIEWRPSKRFADFISLLSLAILAAMIGKLKFYSLDAATWGGVVAEICSAALILSLTVNASVVSRCMQLPVLVKLGAWSYALYMWHYPIARYTRANYDGYASTALTLVVAIILAGLTHELMERPLMARWKYSRYNRKLKYNADSEDQLVGK